jgi:hypothetical protein
MIEEPTATATIEEPTATVMIDEPTVTAMIDEVMMVEPPKAAAQRRRQRRRQRHLLRISVPKSGREGGCGKFRSYLHHRERLMR